MHYAPLIGGSRTSRHIEQVPLKQHRQLAMQLSVLACLVLLLALLVVQPCIAAESEQQQCSIAGSEDAAAFTPRPKACVTDELSANMGNVRDVLQLLGYELVDRPVDANVIWAWRDPFSSVVIPPEEAVLLSAHKQLMMLGNQQYVNQLPGSGFVTSKSELAALSQQLKFLPRTFKLPQDYKAWQAFLTTERGSKLEWIQKSTGHRGISIIADPFASAWAEVKQEVLVQQLVRPYLIAKRSWDVGFYVAVTQLEPLTAYIFTGGALVRFCSAEYVRDITPETDTSSYVVYGLEDFTAAKDVPELAPFHADAVSDTAVGSTLGLTALQGYLGSQGVNTTAWWLEVQSVILQTLLATTDKMAMTQRYYYPGTRTNFFTLLRFDTMLDENQQVYIIEVNMSPGLFKPDLPRHDQLLSRKLVHDLLTLKGLAPGGHLHPFIDQQIAALKYNPDAVLVGEPLCGGSCNTTDACSSKPACLLCRGCRSEWQDGLLTRVMAEQLNAGSFMRLHPPRRALAQHLQDTKVPLSPDVEERPDDVLVRAWLAAKCNNDPGWC